MSHSRIKSPNATAICASMSYEHRPSYSTRGRFRTIEISITSPLSCGGKRNQPCRCNQEHPLETSSLRSVLQTIRAINRSLRTPYMHIPCPRPSIQLTWPSSLGYNQPHIMPRRPTPSNASETPSIILDTDNIHTTINNAEFQMRKTLHLSSPLPGRRWPATAPMVLRPPVCRAPPHGVAPAAVLEHTHHLVLADPTACSISCFDPGTAR